MILIKKAIRSMLRNKKAYISCILLMSLGISLYIVFNSLVLNLSTARDDYYENYRLADIFVKVNAISKNETTSLEKIEGIKEAVPRIVNEFRIEHKDIETLMTVRLISDDLQHNGTTINQYIYDNHNNSNSHSHSHSHSNAIENDTDILLNVEFMSLNNIKIGDTVSIIYSGKVNDFDVIGSVMSPEYVYLTKDATQLVPDKNSFGFGYVSQATLNNISNANNTYNDIVIELEDGYEFDDVKIALENSLNKYGLIELTERKYQTSYAMFEAEFDSIKSMSQSLPMTFLAMVITILYLTLKRVIEQERMEIGMLKAFGYTDFQILNHYLIYGLLTGLLGGVFGCILANSMASELLELYSEYYLLPTNNSQFSLLPYLTGFILSIFCGLIGTFFGVKKVLKLTPVDAMKAEAPIINVKHSKNNSNKFFKKIFKTSGFMALRNIQRNKVRSLFIIIGISFSFAMGAYMASTTKLVDTMMFVQINDVKKYDAKFSFFTPVDDTALHYIQDLESISIANGIYEIPVQLRNKDNSTYSTLIGLQGNSSLYKAYDEKTETNKHINSDGVVLGSYFADILKVKEGDFIYIDSPLLDESIKVLVTDIAQMTMADANYININTLYDMFGVSGYTSIIFNTNNYDIIKNDFKSADNISVIEDKETMNQNLKNMIGSYDIIFDFMYFITIGIVFIIVYNISTISFSERSREYATLKVIGVTTKEIAEIVDLEFWLLTFLGMFLGIFMTKGLKISINNMMDMENLLFDETIYLYEIIISAVQCSLAVFLSNYMNKKNIKKLNLVTVLKERS